jgi:hypothetical protein
LGRSTPVTVTRERPRHFGILDAGALHRQLQRGKPRFIMSKVCSFPPPANTSWPGAELLLFCCYFNAKYGREAVKMELRGMVPKVVRYVECSHLLTCRCWLPRCKPLSHEHVRATVTSDLNALSQGRGRRPRHANHILCGRILQPVVISRREDGIASRLRNTALRYYGIAQPAAPPDRQRSGPPQHQGPQISVHVAGPGLGRCVPPHSLDGAPV